MPRHALLSAATAEHGTPPELVALARAALGRIDLDPASSSTWNPAVGAWRYLDEVADGLATPWVVGAPAPRCVLDPGALRAEPGRDFTVFLNPPGDPRGELVAGFWRALAGYFALGWVSSAIWIGFQLGQLSRLQRVGAPSAPLHHPTVVLAERPEYLRAPGVRGTDPTHASFVTLLARSRATRALFARHARPLGDVVNA